MKLRCVFGVSVAHNLMKIEAADDDVSSSVFEMNGFISNSNYIAKKTTMVLFINDRLVKCTALKRAIEIVYAATLPKAIVLKGSRRTKAQSSPGA